MVTILMVYTAGTGKILNVAIKSLERHNAGFPWGLRLVVDRSDEIALQEVQEWKGHAEIFSYDVGWAKSGSGQHGRLLDKAIREVKTYYTLTMDSDCFPIADGWLKELVVMLEQNYFMPIVAAGIRWPWLPPISDKVGEDTLEWRIRGFHNRDNLQVACQLLRTAEFNQQHPEWKFADPDGDDTNHGFMKKSREEGYKIVGWDVTRCALPDTGVDFDPEFNRHESLIYGDKIYHHVGASRECSGQTDGKSNVFSKARERVYNEFGAEWMLESGNSHTFTFARENEVVDFKMRMMYQMMQQYLLTHGCLFSNDWA